MEGHDQIVEYFDEKTGEKKQFNIITNLNNMNQQVVDNTRGALYGNLAGETFEAIPNHMLLDCVIHGELEAVQEFEYTAEEEPAEEDQFAGIDESLDDNFKNKK